MRLPSRDTLQSIGLLILRVGAGVMLLVGHGWPKLALFAERAGRFADPLGVGSTASLTLTVFAEVFCTAAVALGLLTRLAAVPIVIMLLVAATVVHADDPWARKEFALVYALPFLTLCLTGAGAYSFDHAWGLWRRNRRNDEGKK